MKKMKKRNLIVSLALGAVCVGAFGVGNIATANADFTLTESSFVMNGASIRLEDDNKNGIRFPVRLALKDYTDNAESILETGTLIINQSNYTEGMLTLENAATNDKIHKEVTTEKWFKRTVVDPATSATTDYAESLIYLYNIPDLDEEFYARGYITTAAGTIYSSVADRSISEVASAAIESGVYADDADNLALLDSYLQSYTVTFDVGAYANAVESATVKYGKTVTAPELEVTNESMLFSHWELNGEAYDFNTKVTGDITLTAEYITINEAIAASLGDNEIAMFNSELYMSTLSDLTINKYNAASASNYEIRPVSGENLYKYVPDWNGTGFTVTFAEQNAYTNGSLRILINYDNASSNGRTLYIAKYGETDATKCLTYGPFGTAGRQYVYIPMSELVDENNVLKGLQLSFTRGTWTYFGEMVYVPYAITESISSLTEIKKGESYDITADATNEGVAIENADIRYTVANESVLTIADGKLNAVEAGSTNVTIGYYVDDELQVSKVVTVTVTKSDLEIVADALNTYNTSKGTNYLAMFDSDYYMTAIVSDLKLTGVSQNTGWNLVNPTDAPTYSGIKSSWSGRAIKFANPMTVTDGYLKINIGYDGGVGQTVSLYKYAETNSANSVAVEKLYNQGLTAEQVSTTITGGGWWRIFVPVENLLNENGVLDGIQFTVSGGGNLYFGSIEYVAETAVPWYVAE